jgi:hypothetical protein
VQAGASEIWRAAARTQFADKHRSPPPAHRRVRRHAGNDDAIDHAVAAYQDFIRITGWTGNAALMVEAEFFGRDRPRAEFRDRYGREGGEIRGLTVEEHINRLGQDLIPLAERCARVMREALAALEMLRAGPSQAVERSKPISISIMFEPMDGGPASGKPIGRR